MEVFIVVCHSGGGGQIARGRGALGADREYAEGRNDIGRRSLVAMVRAKYYELACLAKAETGDNGVIAHWIEVLENSFDDIPALWVRKPAELRAECASR